MTPPRPLLEGLLGTLRSIHAPRPPEPPRPSAQRLADLPWDRQLAVLRAERAPLPGITTAIIVANEQAALAWLDRSTTALGREPSTREILETVVGGTPTKSELIAMTNLLKKAGALCRRSGRGRREPLWHRA